MAGPETAGFALVTRRELEFVKDLTAGQLGEDSQLENIHNVDRARLPIELEGDEARVVAGAALHYLRELKTDDYARDPGRIAAMRRVAFRVPPEITSSLLDRQSA